MRKKMIPESEIINLSKTIIQSFYGRNIDNNIHYLADDFMWIGAFDFQYTKTKNDFLKVTQSEINSVAFKMVHDEFTLLSKSSSCYIICAKFNLYGETENNIITTHTRLTIIWKYIGDELKLFHIHGSNAQDVPLTRVTNIENHTEDNFINFINSINHDNINQKLKFKDIYGTYHYFMESEIIYLQANLQNTHLHTIKGDITIHGTLAKITKELPDIFFRIHKKYLLNLNYIQSFKRYTVMLTNGEDLPISKEKFMDFRKFFQNNIN